MGIEFLYRITILLISMALAALQALAQSQPNPIEDKDNPLMIGKRDINNNQLNFYSLDKETALGRQLAAETDRQSKFITDPIITEFVNRVGQNIVLRSDAKVPFTIKVIDSDEINAFALPGGHLYINRGVVEAADNEAELAGVIAHEIAHVTARHGVEQASKGQLANYASIPLIFLGGWGGYAVRQAAGLAIPLGFLKFSRGAEKEADRLGAQYMWASGYDPHAMITFFEKLEAKVKKKPGAIAKVFSTHPMTSDRISEVSDLIARFPDKQEYQVSSSEFNAVRSRLISQAVAQRGTATSNNRPTLKRRPSSTNDNGASDQEPSDRPTLKRGEPAAPESSGESQESTGRPTLKRRSDAGADSNNKS
ncbi:MAG TPA: M48 family metallopeptidase [Blastocatellia bacterium]|nr:M48 family metallopeptidase [Blastocatellia bacterium]